MASQSLNVQTKNGSTNSKFLAKFKWSHPEWIDIAEFLKYAYGCSRGEQHRLCRDLVSDYHKCWVEIILHNSTKHIDKLLNFLKMLHIEHPFSRVTRSDRNRKFGKHGDLKAQSLEDIFNLPSTFKKTCEIFQEAGTSFSNLTKVVDEKLCDQVASVTQVYSNLGTKLNDITDAFQSTLSRVLIGVQDKIDNMAWAMGVVGSWLPSILLFIAKVFSFAYIVSLPGNQNIKVITALITLALPPSVGGNLEFISSLTRAIKGAIGGLFAQAEHDDSFIVSFYKLTKDIMSGMFGNIEKSTFDQMSLSSKKVKLVADYIKGATTLMDFFMKLLEKLFDLVGGQVLKYYGVMPWFLKEDRIGPLIDRFLSMKEKRLDTLCYTNKHAAQQVNQLYVDVMKVEASVVKAKNVAKEFGIKVLPYLRVMTRTLEQIVAKIPLHLLSGKDIRRSKPFWIYIYGEPRVGKSAMFQPYLVNVLAKALKLRTEYEDYTNYTYFRNCGEKYWEKYRNHPVLWYNDLFQNYSDEPAMQNAIVELTNVVDDSMYALNMAFEDKHGVYFDSSVVISNSQDDIRDKNFIASKCLSEGKHLYARRNIVVEFCLNEIYLNHDKTGINYNVMYEHMRNKPCIGVVKPLFPEDMYILHFHDPMTGEVLRSCDFKHGVDYITSQAVLFSQFQDLFKENLYAHFKELWAQAGDEPDAVPKNLNELKEYPLNHTPLFNPDDEKDECIYEKSKQLQNDITNNLTDKLVEKFDVDEVVEEIKKQYPIAGQQFYDASSEEPQPADAEYLFRHFDAAVRKVMPELSDSTVLSMVKQAVIDGDKHVLTALGTYDMSENVDDLEAKISIVIQVAGVKTWSEFTRKRASRSLAERVKFEWKSLWGKFVERLMAFVRDHPILTNIVIRVALFVVYMWLIKTLFAACGITDDKNVAQTAEGSSKEKTKQVVRQRKVQNGVAAQSYDDQNIVVEQKIKNHVCKFVLVVRDVDDLNDIDVRHFGSGLNVGSDVFVLPRHFWTRWNVVRDFYRGKGNKVILKLFWDEEKVVDVPWDVITCWEPDYMHTEDIVFLRIKNLVQLTHLDKFFVSSNDQPNLFETYLFGMRQSDYSCTLLGVSQGEFAANVTYEHAARIEPIYNGKFSNKIIYIPVCYKYMNCNTVGGDCGMLYLNSDSKLNCRKILGMHTAANTKTGLGISSPIFKEDVEEAFNVLYGKEIKMTFQSDSVEDCNEVVAQSEEYKKLEQTGVNIVGVKNTIVDDIGRIKKFKITLPRKSKIRHSVVYDIMEKDLGPSTVAPAQLRPFVKDDEIISPLYEGLKKIAVCSNMVSKDECNKVTQHMYESMKDWHTPYKDMFVLNNFDMINGYGLMKAMDMSTSAGFPYSIIHNGRGKLPFFKCINENPKQFEGGTYVMDEFCSRETLAKQGIIKETYFIDTLKDEVRDLDKVESGRTRIFQIAPVDFNMMLRKYFGTFISFCHSVYLSGEMAIGINANSYEWTIMVKNLLENGNTFINGDGKNFDASLGQQYMMEVCEVVNKFYDDGAENALIRRVLFATFLNSRHIVGNLVYVARQGNKSGSALTTIFNNLAGMFAIRLAFLRFHGSLHNFYKIVTPKFYGDDDLISVNSLLTGMDSLYYQKVWQSLGVKYTAADKSAVLLKYYTLEQISFLQRKFVLDGKFNVYLAQLCYETICEIARWSESDPYNMEDQMNRFNSTLLELSNYGKDRFEIFRSMFSGYIIDLQLMGFNIKITNLFNFEYCKQLIFPELYGKVLGNDWRDLSPTFDQCREMLSIGGGGSE